MSTLQISLAVLGVVLLALIVAYNSWSARRNAPRRADPEAQGVQGDPLRNEPGMDTVGHGPDLTHSLREPVLGDFGKAVPGAEPLHVPEAAGRFAEADAELARIVAQEAYEEQQRQAALEAARQQAAAPAAAAAVPQPAARPAQPQAEAEGAAERAPVEPVLTEAPLAAPAAAAAVERRSQLDALIDAIAPIQVAQPVPGEVAIQALPSTRRAGNKPFAIEGMNQQTRQWEPLQAGQRYIAFQAGVQLANRTGALNEIEFSEFVAKVQRFADALGVVPDMPDMLHEVARARELDQFASEHDAQLSFMLRARQASWSAGYVQQNAGRLGFVASAMPGRMALSSPTPGMPPVLLLHYDPQAALADDLDQSVVREILLSLDVAQVPRGEQPFAQLRQIAEQLCQTMDGVLCDQNGYLLPVSALDPIQHDLELLYDKLDSRELSAGSLLARRLFS
ncbi:cell division protein FtsZ [Comamonas sp. w2-DMI]|uniref:cell division protein FtsZ n=1 Tax=Comamonas sp. w2-DMI TaxID=3126391 RepID=UPI0032E399B2